MEVGNGVEVFDYYAPGVSEYGHIVLIQHGLVHIKLFNDRTCIFLKSAVNKKWCLDDLNADYDVFKEELEYLIGVTEKAVKTNDKHLKSDMQIIHLNVKLNKSDFQKLLNAAIDRRDWEECTRVYKKMEALA